MLAKKVADRAKTTAVFVLETINCTEAYRKFQLCIFCDLYCILCIVVKFNKLQLIQA